MGKAKSVNIKSYKRKRQMNLGIVLFSVVLIYLAVAIITYVTGKKIAACEVREGSILEDRFFTGIALREEKTITAQEGGYINYLQSDCSKLGAGMGAYVITPSPIPYRADAAAPKDVPLKRRQELAAMIQNFNESYSPEDFSGVYAFKNEVKNFISKSFDLTKPSKIEDILKESGMSAKRYDAPRDGIMVQCADGYENLTFDSLKEADFDSERYKPTVIRDNDPIEKGAPAYRMALSEKWEIIVKPDEKTAEKLIGLSCVDTRINEDNKIIRAGVSIAEKDGELYCRLKYNDFMIRYAKERFLNVEVILKDVKGLKIPKSSLTERDFFVIPKGYLIREKDGNEFGVNLQNENGSTEFAPVTIYDVNEEGMAFIGRKGFPAGSVIIRPDFEEKYEVKKTGALTGVFFLNKGYAEFKRVDILCESGDYCIVGYGDVYGIHNYDHIALDASKVSEGEIIF